MAEGGERLEHIKVQSRDKDKEKPQDISSSQPSSCPLPALDYPLTGPGSENWRQLSARTAFTLAFSLLGYVYGPHHYGQVDQEPPFWKEQEGDQPEDLLPPWNLIKGLNAMADGTKINKAMYLRVLRPSIILLQEFQYLEPGEEPLLYPGLPNFTWLGREFFGEIYDRSSFFHPPSFTQPP